MLPKRVATAVWDNDITINVVGIIINDAYLTEDPNTFCRIVCSFFPSIFENAGNNIVDTGVTKKVTSTRKFRVTW